jgi:hypothetical protein
MHRQNVFVLIFGMISLLSITDTSVASPPLSCACKFVGVWKYSVGTTTIFANGKMAPNCNVGVPCVTEQTWTCDGDRITFRNDTDQKVPFEGRLVSPTQLQGATWTATRVGGTGSCAGARPPETHDKACRGDASSFLIPEKKPGLGKWVIHNMCAEKTIHGHWTTFGPCSVGDSGPGEDTIAPGKTSEAFYSYCQKPRIDSATFAQ